MRILQPADWSKPRGFSHGVALDGPGRWIVLAGQTGGDGKGDYQPDMAGPGGGAPPKNLQLPLEGRARPPPPPPPPPRILPAPPNTKPPAPRSAPPGAGPQGATLPPPP